MIAALFVATDGCYFGLPDVDPWDEPRDARRYAGPWPVVAHPPCSRWGRYWHGGPSARERKTKGDDGGCFASALASVRRFGGVLEHPEASAAWRTFGLVTPFRWGGWTHADLQGGFTCTVEQGHYGHRARKATWLYINGVDASSLPQLRWGPSHAGVKLDQGFHTRAERQAAAGQTSRHRRMHGAELLATPPQFRDALLALARSVSQSNLEVRGEP